MMVYVPFLRGNLEYQGQEIILFGNKFQGRALHNQR